MSVVILGCLAIAPSGAVPSATAQSALPKSALRADPDSVALSSLPPTPPGKSTIIGGEIRVVDSVRDELTLAVYGQRSTRIFFDERTLVYRDGTRTSLHDLRPNDHASIQTVLDGTNIFAISIHMLSRSPEGEYQGHVLSYNPETTELNVGRTPSRAPFAILVPGNTLIVRAGQSPFSSVPSGIADLVKGSLISVTFVSDDKGRGIASSIAVLATPGSAFEFVGDISFLDMHRGLLELTDPLDDKAYEVSFDSARLPATSSLHDGDHIRVSATFDGARYVANEIAVN
jgi:hypothetical protein